jgi:two-component system sensor histidine kinase AlgZ
MKRARHRKTLADQRRERAAPGLYFRMASINQNAYSSALPNFHNLGIVLRIIVAANVYAMLVALAGAASWSAFWNEVPDALALLQPLLIASLLALMACNAPLQRLPYAFAAILIVAFELALTAALHAAARPLLGIELPPLARALLLTLAACGVLLFYFDLRARALSPALSEARLQALQARIRPHFLYNSINAVLSLMRQDPRRAETALEDLAGLFRVLMADNRELSTLAREVELCRQYLDIEQLRLGERLKVEWHIDKMPAEALVPPLVLQPLLENAVYHGIEPQLAPGPIVVDIYTRREQLHIRLRNPYERSGSHHGGNKMALANIRERLALHFDAEASLQTRVGETSYEVHIAMPWVKDAAR